MTALDRYLQLVDRELPARGRAQRWVVHEDHCFARILLDHLFADAWYGHVDGRPAYRHLSAQQLEQAVAMGERILAEGDELLRRLNEESLAWRSGYAGPRR